MLHHVSRINSLYLFVSLIRVPVPPFMTHLFLSPITSSSFDSPLCSSITPSIFHSWLKTRSSTSSSQPTFHGLLPGLFLLSKWFFVISFLYFFISMPCARLRWPSCQLLNARNYTVSYCCIVTNLWYVERGWYLLGFD